jgi:hypothetical protein
MDYSFAKTSFRARRKLIKAYDTRLEEVAGFATTVEIKWKVTLSKKTQSSLCDLTAQPEETDD